MSDRNFQVALFGFIGSVGGNALVWSDILFGTLNGYYPLAATLSILTMIFTILWIYYSRKMENNTEEVLQSTLGDYTEAA